MSVFLSIIFVACQVFFGHTTANQLCTTEKLQECYDLLNKDGLPSVTVLYFSEEQMTEHCRRYKIFSECMKTIKPYCTESGNMSYLAYQGLLDAYGFVCGDGFTEYVQYQTSCFKEDDIQLEAKTCSDVFTVRSIYLKTNITDKKYARARYCQYIDDYIDCVYNLLLSFCGNAAANWHKTFDAKSVQPTMVAFGCPGWPITEKDTTTSNSAAIWVISLGAAIVVTGAMVVIGIGLLVCSRCRCRRRSIRRSVSVDMPPPYSAPPFIISRMEEESSRSRPPSGSPERTRDSRRQKTPSGPKTTAAPAPAPAAAAAGAAAATDGELRRVKCDAPSTTENAAAVFEDRYEVGGAVGGSPASSSSSAPFVRSYTPFGHFELPSPGSSILSYLQSSDDDSASLISHTCDYY